MITGKESGATAYLNGHTIYTYGEGENSVIKDSILLASANGSFISGEPLIIKNPDTNDTITVMEIERDGVKELIDFSNVCVEFYEEATGVWDFTTFPRKLQ